MKYECEISIAHKLRFYVNAETSEEAVKMARRMTAEKMNANEFISGLSVSPKLVVNGRAVIVNE
jgi:hypothetical protein